MNEAVNEALRQDEGLLLQWMQNTPGLVIAVLARDSFRVTSKHTQAIAPTLWGALRVVRDYDSP